MTNEELQAEIDAINAKINRPSIFGRLVPGVSFSGVANVFRWLWEASPKIVSCMVLAGALVWGVGHRGCSLPVIPWFTPSDPLTAKLQAAYAMDTDADRAASLKFLQDVYPLMAANPPLPFPPTNMTALAWLKTRVGGPPAGLPVGKVTNLRHAIGAEMAAELGTDGAGMTNITLFTAALRKIGDALKGVR